MKKKNITEIMGIAGLAIWLLTIIIRKSGMMDYSRLSLSTLIIWTAPNFGGAWFSTALVKQLFCPLYAEKTLVKKPYTQSLYLFICMIIFIIALILEFLNPYIFNDQSKFDLFDVMATLLAQILIFLIPVIFDKNVFVSNHVK